MHRSLPAAAHSVNRITQQIFDYNWRPFTRCNEILAHGCRSKMAFVPLQLAYITAAEDLGQGKSKIVDGDPLHKNCFETGTNLAPPKYQMSSSTDCYHNRNPILFFNNTHYLAEKPLIYKLYNWSSTCN